MAIRKLAVNHDFPPQWYILDKKHIFWRPMLFNRMIVVDTHWQSLCEWKDNGDARYIGATVSNNRDHEQMELFMKNASPDIIQVNYSIGEPQAELRILPLAESLGIAVLTNRPFMNGSFFQHIQGHNLPEWAMEFDCESRAQFTLKYTLSNPAVTCALTETTSPGHMLDNIGASFGRLPDSEIRLKMRARYESMATG